MQAASNHFQCTAAVRLKGTCRAAYMVVFEHSHHIGTACGSVLGVHLLQQRVQSICSGVERPAPLGAPPVRKPCCEQQCLVACWRQGPVELYPGLWVSQHKEAMAASSSCLVRHAQYRYSERQLAQVTKLQAEV